MFASSKSGSVSAPTDSKFNYVTMLLHGNGTNGAQNNTFIDSSTNNFTITRNGNTTQGTFTPYGSNWSNYFSSNSGLTAPNNSAFKPATNDFTVEAWIFQTSSGTEQAIYGDSNSVTDAGTFDFNISSTGFLKSDYWTSSTAITTRTSTLSPTVNQWNHVVISRTGTTLYLGLNGVLQSFTAPSSYQSPATTYPTVGRLGAYTSGIGFIGYISNFRYINGTNLYSGSTYTVPTAPLTAITNTVLLTSQSNRFIDNSTNSFALTVNGSPSVQRFSPFSPTTAYSTSVIGGSGYFDGSGDSLKVTYGSQMNLTNQDFAIEFWLYIPSALSNRSIVCQDQSNYQLNAYVDTSNNLTFYSYQASGTQNFAVAMGSVPVGAWSHFVIARTSSTVAGFRNGTRIATATFSGSVDAQTGGWYLGAVYSNLNQINGYLSDVRFVIGSNPYGVGTTLTIPTAPLTAVTNTQFLASFTNAGILDNAMMNDLETVGNAQISTSVKKYGTGSLAFDGSGDGLAIPANVNLAVGSTDFTIEMWVNGANSGSPVGGSFPRLFTLGTAQGAGCIESYNASGTMYVDISGAGGPISFTASTLLNSTWNHYAITRSGTSLKAFVNGTQVGSTATNSVNINLSATTQSWIGSISASAGNFNGYIDDLRITKGVARYTANFTPPTAAFPNN